MLFHSPSLLIWLRKHTNRELLSRAFLILRKLQVISRPTGGSTRNGSSPLVLCVLGERMLDDGVFHQASEAPGWDQRVLCSRLVACSVLFQLSWGVQSRFLDNKNIHENLSKPPNLPQTNLPKHHFQAPLAFEVKFCYTLRLWLSESQCITELCLESFLAAMHLGVGGKNRPFKSFEHRPKLIGSFSVISI